MSKSVSNDALWEKLLELDKKLEKLYEIQKPSNLSDKQVVSKPDFQKEKDEIVAEIRQQIGLLGNHSDINFRTVNENIRKAFNIVARIRKQQKAANKSQKTDCSYFNFSFFKVRKTSLVIAVLGLLVFVLTLFCMKQQNDYALLLNEYYRQNIVIDGIKMDADSLRAAVQQPKLVKKRW